MIFGYEAARSHFAAQPSAVLVPNMEKKGGKKKTAQSQGERRAPKSFFFCGGEFSQICEKWEIRLKKSEKARASANKCEQV